MALYAATIGVEAENYVNSLKSESEEYSYMLAQTLCDSIVEALSAHVQKSMFADFPGARSGVRAAVGYPSYPDHSEKAKFEKLLSLEDSVGVRLTDNYMMTPKSTVAAIWIANPSAVYFSAQIGRDQIEDYAQRNKRNVSDVEKYISVKPL